MENRKETKFEIPKWMKHKNKVWKIVLVLMIFVLCVFCGYWTFGHFGFTIPSPKENKDYQFPDIRINLTHAESIKLLEFLSNSEQRIANNSNQIGRLKDTIDDDHSQFKDSFNEVKSAQRKYLANFTAELGELKEKNGNEHADIQQSVKQLKEDFRTQSEKYEEHMKKNDDKHGDTQQSVEKVVNKVDKHYSDLEKKIQNSEARIMAKIEANGKKYRTPKQELWPKLKPMEKVQ